MVHPLPGRLIYPVRRIFTPFVAGPSGFGSPESEMRIAHFSPMAQSLVARKGLLVRSCGHEKVGLVARSYTAPKEGRPERVDLLGRAQPSG